MTTTECPLFIEETNGKPAPSGAVDSDMWRDSGLSDRLHTIWEYTHTVAKRLCGHQTITRGELIVKVTDMGEARPGGQMTTGGGQALIGVMQCTTSQPGEFCGITYCNNCHQMAWHAYNDCLQWKWCTICHQEGHLGFECPTPHHACNHSDCLLSDRHQIYGLACPVAPHPMYSTRLPHTCGGPSGKRCFHMPM